jgi:hypothetical protein
MTNQQGTMLPKCLVDHKESPSPKDKEVRDEQELKKNQVHPNRNQKKKKKARQGMYQLDSLGMKARYVDPISPKGKSLLRK